MGVGFKCMSFDFKFCQEAQKKDPSQIRFTRNDNTFDTTKEHGVK